MSYLCKHKYCNNKASWTCDGCNKIYCASHQDMRDHTCRECHYCTKTATTYCTGCQKYFCSGYCSNHMKNCHIFKSSNSSSSSICKLCIRGQIPGDNSGTVCYMCYGTGQVLL